MKNLKPFLISLFILFLFLNCFPSEYKWKQGELAIIVFDVGQADSQLIISPTGKTLLIDVGETTWNSSSNSKKIAGKLKDIMGSSFNKIDYILATHLHTDHIGYVGKGGIWRLIEKEGFSVGKLIDRDAGTWIDSNGNGDYDEEDEIQWHNIGSSEESKTAPKWIAYVIGNPEKIHREIAEIDSENQINLGTGIKVKIIELDALGVKSRYGKLISGDHSDDYLPPSENDYSITLKISYDKFDYVTGGDTDGEYKKSDFGYRYNDIESAIAAKIGEVEVMHVNHHGSSHSSNQKYLDTLNPDISILSCGIKNKYGHPDEDTLQRLISKSKVYLTEEGDPEVEYSSTIVVNGDIIIVSKNGSSYTINGNSYNAKNSQ